MLPNQNIIINYCINKYKYHYINHLFNILLVLIIQDKLYKENKSNNNLQNISMYYFIHKILHFTCYIHILNFLT